MNASDYADIIAAITATVITAIASGTIILLSHWWWTKSRYNRGNRT